MKNKPGHYVFVIQSCELNGLMAPQQITNDQCPEHDLLNLFSPSNGNNYFCHHESSDIKCNIKTQQLQTLTDSSGDNDFPLDKWSRMCFSLTWQFVCCHLLFLTCPARVPLSWCFSSWQKLLQLLEASHPAWFVLKINALLSLKNSDVLQF